MSKKEAKDELEDVETIPREQAEKEMREAVRKVQQGGGSKKHAAEPEDEPVTPESRRQAEHELHDAIERVRKEREKQHK